LDGIVGRLDQGGDAGAVDRRRDELVAGVKGLEIFVWTMALPAVGGGAMLWTERFPMEADSRLAARRGGLVEKQCGRDDAPGGVQEGGLDGGPQSDGQSLNADESAGAVQGTFRLRSGFGRDRRANESRPRASRGRGIHRRPCRWGGAS